jgi:1,4-dihydroxy-2-naphthoyl-CoA hydrolase
MGADSLPAGTLPTGATTAGPTLASLSLEDASAFLQAASLAVDEITGSRVTGHLQLGPEHHTPWGIVHGGVYATAIESAASIGASSAVRDQGQVAVGL